ncbi:uncharacterized protein DDB_G0274171-like [Dreissena polymorpha]|uniref:Uncharacterized protein n=1 Tax=Dreissena polymorpha TaxID=45954 RepID=A0A9D4I963_DREPO|nr:uncharacterized protein DDB_G0274171-like [Dreissena polymorpha]KAH3752950.1 hypothetical protein DPMN_187576 [Dreissena polymorpha]
MRIYFIVALFGVAQGQGQSANSSFDPCSGILCGPLPTCPDGSAPITPPDMCCPECSPIVGASNIQSGGAIQPFDNCPPCDPLPTCADGSLPSKPPGECCPYCPPIDVTPPFDMLPPIDMSTPGFDVYPPGNVAQPIDVFPPSNVNPPVDVFPPGNVNPPVDVFPPNNVNSPSIVNQPFP